MVIDMLLANSSGSICVIDKQVKWTYKDMRVQIDLIKELLKDEQLVALATPNSAESIAIYFACLEEKIPILFINSDTNLISLENILQKYRATCLVVSESFPDLPYQGEVVKYGPIKILKFLGTQLDINRELALLLPTSGSTGSSKYVRLSSANLIENTNSIIHSLDIQEQVCTLLNMPMSYSFGLSIINTNLKMGGTVVLDNSNVTGRDFWEKVIKCNINTLAGVPFYIETLSRLQLPRMPRQIRINQILQAGGKLSRNSISKMLDFGRSRNFEFCVMYGQTEATARMSVNRGESLLQKPDSVGKSILNGVFSVETPNSHLIPSNNSENVGSVVYRGPNVMLGYAQDFKDLSLGDINQGVLRTGDLGFLDEDGMLYITGRESRFVKIAGFRTSLDDIEAELSIDGDVGVIARNEQVFVFLQSSDHDWVRKKLVKLSPILRNNIHTIEIPEIPRNTNGKIDYNALQGILDD
jgi:long-chain acyl-CoA synthetase